MPTSTRGRDPAVEEAFLGALYKGGELLASGKIVEAREHLEKAHGLEPKNEKAQNLLGLTYFKLGLFDRASEVYEKLVNENPADATLRVNLGLVYLKTNNLERCIKEFETATDLEPTHKKAHNYLGLALAQQGTYVKAKEHFELAGSDQMAEKMGRAIAAQSTPSGMHAPVARQSPKTVVLGSEEEPPRPPPLVAEPPRADEETIEVMSDEELPSDVYVVPEEELAAVVAPPPPPPSAPSIESDWGMQTKAPPEPESNGEMRFAEDEGPPEADLVRPPAATVEELPMLDAAVEVMPEAEMPVPAPTAPAWLTMEAAEAARPSNETAWVTETVADVPLTTPTPVPAEAPVADNVGATDARWDTAPQPEENWAESGGVEAPPPQEEPAPHPTVPDDSWAAATDAPAVQPLPEPTWTTEPAALDPVPSAPGEGSWASNEPVPAEDASWASAETAPAIEPLPNPDSSWSTAETAPAIEPLPTTPEDSSWATGAAETTPAIEPLPTTPEDSSWATGAAVETAPAIEPLPTTPEDSSWATGAPAEAAPAADDSSWATGTPEAAAATQWATEQIEGVPQPTATEAEQQWEAATTSEPIQASAPEPALEVQPEPSAPLPITVEEPVDAPPPAAPPAGYTPMSPQRLVDLGASGAWVHEPSAGPFHVSNDGLAVTVAGEMLVRMTGLVAIVGSVTVTPENRRRRGRSTAEPFGAGTSQLQRAVGNGVLYLEPERSKFHAVDLTDQNGVNIDDDGAYLREELVFAFEEAISFENGKLTAEGQTLELAHLKGNGRILLQLNGSLRTMPIPVGAPMVVPLHRVVGWFGRVTPRLMGFGGRGAIELTGEGYALLGAPVERP